MLRERETYHIVGKKRIRVSSKKVRFHGGSYPVDVSYPTYTKGNKNIYFLDVKIINQILMSQDGETPKGFEWKPTELDGTDSRYELMSPKTLDIFVSQSFLSALFSRLTSSGKLAIGSIVMGLLAGTGIGWIIHEVITGGYF